MDASRRVDAGLSHPLARPTLLFGLVMLLIAAIVGDVLSPRNVWTPAECLAIVAITVDFVVATTRRPGPLARWRLALVVGLSCLSAALLLLPGEGAPAGPLFGYLGLGVALLVPRGHPVIGTVTFGFVFAGLVSYKLMHGLELPEQAETVAQPFIVIVACWILYLFSRTVAGRRSHAVARQFATIAETDAARSTGAPERRAMSEIPRLVEPLLARLAAGEHLDEEFRAELVAADEEVRGLIRLDVPYHPALMRAVDAARRGGASVRLIGAEDPAGARISAATSSHSPRRLGGSRGRADLRRARRTTRLAPRRRRRHQGDRALRPAGAGRRGLAAAGVRGRGMGADPALRPRRGGPDRRRPEVTPPAHERLSPCAPR
ncbi:MAG: hypothetical protein D3X82_07010 [Candidatus Leucobacter sulfamidivorax]|nr:hypothetical protein [Candidatus Leucobacter sulfamidivorax]